MYIFKTIRNRSQKVFFFHYSKEFAPWYRWNKSDEVIKNCFRLCICICCFGAYFFLFILFVKSPLLIKYGKELTLNFFRFIFSMMIFIIFYRCLLKPICSHRCRVVRHLCMCFFIFLAWKEKSALGYVTHVCQQNDLWIVNVWCLRSLFYFSFISSWRCSSTEYLSVLVVQCQLEMTKCTRITCVLSQWN